MFRFPLLMLLLLMFVPARASALPPAQAEDAEAWVMQRVADRYCYHRPPGLYDAHVSISQASYGFHCVVSAGHSITVEITRYPDAAAARAAFTAARGANPLQSFQGYPAYEWLRPLTSPFTEHGYSFQIDRWVVLTSSQDDTHFWVTLSMEVIYQTAALYCLFPGQICHMYVPLIKKSG